MKNEEWYVILNMNCKYEICRMCPKSGLFKGSYKECEEWIKQKKKEEMKDEEKQIFEKWFEEKKEKCEVYGNGDDFWVDDEIKKFCLMGYELGLKAGRPQWHEDLPTEDVRLAIIEVKDCGYLLCEYRKGVWYDEGSSAVCKDWITRNIKRWKEIVLPKESE